MLATGLVALLIFVEPDFGTTALTGLVALTILFIAGSRWRYLLPTVAAGAGAFALAVMHNPVRMKRILAFLDPQGTSQGAGYQNWQSLLALGSGGLTGRGLGNSSAKFFYLPEARTDFILAIVGEELGLLGSLALLLALMVMVICGIRIALRARELYGSLLALGLTALIGFQALINIGVVTGALPNKGLPLPFISFGGSNLVMNLFAIGILVNIARHASPETSEDEQPAAPVGQKWRAA
jgi:cell division protein FtsW